MKSRRRREWFRRSSAMFMALALIISGLSLPEGLFSITAKAAEKASAEWTASSTMYADGDNDNSVTELNGKSGKLVNSNNDELLINANYIPAKYVTSLISNLKASLLSNLEKGKTWNFKSVYDDMIYLNCYVNILQHNKHYFHYYNILQHL